MSATGISEFTFGFAFLYEQTAQHWTGLKAAPILPSLQQEAHDAWDAKLPTLATDYYYQFKLSDYLTRGNAKYIADGTYTTPYFRIALHRRDNNRQHMRLRDHCKSHPETYYVAPEFSGLTEFNSSFLAKQVTQRSRLIKLSDCVDIYDGNQHYITFAFGNVACIQHSEPRRIESSDSGENLEEVYRRGAHRWRAVDVSFAEGIFNSTASEIVQRFDKDRATDRSAIRLVDVPPSERTRAGYLLRTADLLSIYYGLALVLVGTTGN